MISVTERELIERLAWQERLVQRDKKTSPVIVFLYTPLCGTCGAARKMLDVTEQLLPEGTLLEADVNFLPVLVQQYQIRSVPALLAISGTPDKPPQVLYRMGSVQDILNFVRGVML
ncbi:thioredoxin family protein [Paenibacillus sp. N3/727]|uniref:thioredoxin family protein n=1 Tax=Paenibacillus sp. N3/727 TaxID=2925845 RepID=UPI001F52F8DC|nr:thioredoxin family protein [Paenibacillus sp. N3/727]UNK20848.1 thioredoxin family protein [Paenibacillus sp. N3/727]